MGYVLDVSPCLRPMLAAVFHPMYSVLIRVHLCSRKGGYSRNALLSSHHQDQRHPPKDPRQLAVKALKPSKRGMGLQLLVYCVEMFVLHVRCFETAV